MTKDDYFDIMQKANDMADYEIEYISLTQALGIVKKHLATQWEMRPDLNEKHAELFNHDK